ncbi:MAG: VanZ family protein [Microbacteriaceae bacterium]
MISTLLAEYPVLARGGTALVLILAPFIAAWLRPRQQVAWVLAYLSAAAIAVLTLVPDGTRTVAGCELPFSPSFLLGVEPLANLVLFVPLALTVTAAIRRGLPAFLVGLGVSAAIELAQWAVPAIGRSCTSTDFIANSVGAALGAALAALGMYLASRRHLHT